MPQCINIVAERCLSGSIAKYPYHSEVPTVVGTQNYRIAAEI